MADVRANFFLYNPQEESIVYHEHDDLMKRINQPKDCAVFNQTAIVFKAPKYDH